MASKKNNPKKTIDSVKMDDYFIDLEAFLEFLTDIMDRKNLTTIEVEDGDRSVKLERGMRAMPPSAMPSTPIPMTAGAPAPTSAPAGDMTGAVKSPVVGTVYLSPKPGEPNFVKVGDKVTKGAVLMIVEAMKVMNQITAPKDGTVTSIMVNNEDPVEFGQPLLVLG